VLAAPGAGGSAAAQRGQGCAALDGEEADASGLLTKGSCGGQLYAAFGVCVGASQQARAHALLLPLGVLLLLGLQGSSMHGCMCRLQQWDSQSPDPLHT
jgi:hypothetical protein